MKTSQILIVAVVVLVIGAGTYLLLKGGGKINPSNNSINIGKITTSQTFTGTLQSAVEKGIPLKCTAPKDPTSGIEVVAGYLKGKNYFAEINRNGKTGYIIMVGNCMWNWDNTTKQGIKTCMQGDIWAQQTAKSNYECKTADVSDSLFTPPSDIKFTDEDQAGNN